MAMSATRAEWTVDMLDVLPDDGQRYELVDGVVHVTPAPGLPHQLIVGQLYHLFRLYLRGSTVARALISPSDVRRGDRTRNRVQPDTFVVRLVDGKLPRYPFAMTDLLLAVEVSSPNDPLYDYQTKRALYIANNIPEYWVINPEARNLSRWRDAADPGEVLSARVEWQPVGMPESFVLDLPRFFDEAIA
jgi:Uma2 family endonuclease